MACAKGREYTLRPITGTRKILISETGAEELKPILETPAAMENERATEEGRRQDLKLSGKLESRPNEDEGDAGSLDEVTRYRGTSWCKTGWT